MSFQLRRTSITLALLVITPVALLAWLGTYLIRDAARSTDNARGAILAERLFVAESQLLHDLRQFTDHLDELGASPGMGLEAAGREVARHPWVAEVWMSPIDGSITILEDKKTVSPTQDALASARSSALRDQLNASGINAPFASISPQPFALLGSPPESSGSPNRKAVWQTAVKSIHYHLDSHGSKPGFASGWHVTDGDFIYWRQTPTGLLCARMDGQQLGKALFARLPIPGMNNYPGRLTLTTLTGISLHNWGRSEPGSDDMPVATKTCAAPLTQWKLAYTPAFSEFPKPYLFPILLGVGSGCLLVGALAWTFFRENDREIRVAQQRVSFVNQISHELKTPLTNIRLYTEMAAHRIEESGDMIGKRHLGVVETEVARLDRLIQNVLNYARQQRDKLGIQTRPISLDHVVGRAVDHWRLLLERKGFELHTRFLGPNEMTADPDAIEQIIGNLISNVDKYAGYGKWISIQTEHLPEKGVARIIVEDHGPGIPTNKRRTVFEPFERLRSDLNEGVSGTGIGLTISRELADLHGGSLEVCPNYKNGARFILILPLQPKS